MTEKPYTTNAERARKRRAEERRQAINKLAGPDKKPRCSICGCPHAEILQIGHPIHRNGRFHRRALSTSGGSRNVVGWVLRTPIEEIREKVQLECPYCNAWHNRFKEYPPAEKQPMWLPKFLREMGEKLE